MTTPPRLPAKKPRICQLSPAIFIFSTILMLDALWIFSKVDIDHPRLGAPVDPIQYLLKQFYKKT